MDVVVQINDVTKRYEEEGRPAVDGVSLQVGRGEAVAAMGPSGSGKSTLLNAVLPVMAAADNLGVPPGLAGVYGTGEVVALALAGIAIAVAGAMLPASWSAKARTGPALHAE
jgi:putative ABC transport system permease protein